jgi:2-methylcitrate dehydratase PrpD
MTSAIGIAGSGAGGTWAFIDEGNTIKRVHPGLASKSGVVAAFLARDGITGPSRILEADWGGFYGTHLQGEEYYPENVTDRLGSDWQILNAGFKPYASCRRIHGPLDSLFEAIGKHAIKPEQVCRISVWGNTIHKRQLSKYPVNTVLEAQFSLPYTLASALLTGGAGLDQYTDAALKRPEVRPVAELVDVQIDPQLPETGEPRVEIELVDGSVVSATVHIPKGHPRNPLTPGEITAKFRANAGLILLAPQVDELEAMLASLDELDDSARLAALLRKVTFRDGEVPG